MSTPHDALFRFTFGQPEHAAPLLRALLPGPLATAIDWQSLTVLSGSQVDKVLRQQHSDLLFTVRLGDRQVLLYLLLEHKSRNDPWTALQLLSYVVGIWKDLRRKKPRPRRLPPVIPLVLHHGRHGWTSATELAGLLDVANLDGDVSRHLLALQPQFRYLLETTAGRSEDHLRGLALTLLGKLTLAVMQFMARRPPIDALAAFARWGRIAREVLRAPSGHEALEALSSYVLMTTALDPDKFAVVVEEHIGTEARTIMKTAAARLRAEGKAEAEEAFRTTGERLRAEGRAEAEAAFKTTGERLRAEGRAEAEAAFKTTGERLRAEGRAEAEAAFKTTGERLRAEGRAEAEAAFKTTGERLRAEGEREGRVAIVTRLLIARFGPQPETVLQRLRHASAADLDRWAEHVLTAQTCDGVFA